MQGVYGGPERWVDDLSVVLTPSGTEVDEDSALKIGLYCGAFSEDASEWSARLRQRWIEGRTSQSRQSRRGAILFSLPPVGLDRLRRWIGANACPQTLGQYMTDPGHASTNTDSKRVRGCPIALCLVSLPWGCGSIAIGLLDTGAGRGLFDPPPKHAPELNLPQGASNLAAGKPVTSSVKDLVIGDLGMVTDGDKGGWESADGVYVADEGHYVEIGQGTQYVQVDLQEDCIIDAIWIWHRHPYEGHEVPRDVVVQVADEPSFSGGATTVFNSDTDGSLGLGQGADRRYATSRFGKLIPAVGVPGRYVRIWLNGGARNDTISSSK